MTRLCTNATSERSECGAIMKEYAAHFECPECGEVVLMTAAEIAEKIVREQRAAQLTMPRRKYATEEGDVIAND